MIYENLPDKQLFELANKNDFDAIETLLNRYKNIVDTIIRPYYLIGGDVEDLKQEGMIGLFRAIVTYNGTVSFKTYAYKCIKNRIFTLIKQSNLDKNKPLNNYVSLSGYVDSDLDKSDIVLDDCFDPESEYINKENEKELKNAIKQNLSEYENTILNLFLLGYSYEDIGKQVNKNTKSIDNALQRIRKKLVSLIK